MVVIFTTRRVHGSQAHDATGIVIVIDVIRAFTVSAYALAGGARRLWLVRTMDDARALRAAEPEALLAGEVGGKLIAGFDFNNSPAMMAAADVRGRTIIQRTGAGTQGAMNARGARYLLVCALVNARATAAHAQSVAGQLGEHTITLVPTAAPTEEDGIPAIEDDVCADYLEALLTDPASAQKRLEAGLARLRASGRLGVFEHGWPDFPAEDAPAFMAVDRFDFAMAGTRRDRAGVEYVEVERSDSTP